jgi:hypothetical protein
MKLIIEGEPKAVLPIEKMLSKWKGVSITTEGKPEKVIPPAEEETSNGESTGSEADADNGEASENNGEATAPVEAPKGGKKKSNK